MIKVKMYLFNFKKSCSGSVVMLVALLFPLILGAVGGAIDYSRSVNVRLDAQKAADAAVLTLLKIYLTQNDKRLAENTALGVFFNNVDVDQDDDQWSVTADTFEVENNYLTATVTAETVVNTFIMQIIGDDHFNVSVEAKATIPIQAITVVMAADVSGSMSGQRIIELKDAARQFGADMFNAVPEFEPLLRVVVVCSATIWVRAQRQSG